MSRFIKLTNMIFNTNDIHKIIIEPNKYYIYIISKEVNGFHWNIGIAGSGHIRSCTSYIEVCKIKHYTDYKIVSNWISKN